MDWDTGVGGGGFFQAFQIGVGLRIAATVGAVGGPPGGGLTKLGVVVEPYRGRRNELDA